MQGIYFQLKNHARVDGYAYHTSIIMALTLCVINLTSFRAVPEILVNYFSLSQVHIWSSSVRNDRFVCSAISTDRRRLVSRQRYALLFIHENAWNFWEFCPTRTKLLYSLVSWSLLCVPETLPRQKQSWQSWYEWHFWHLYRKPVKFSLWHASHMTGWATEKSRTCMFLHVKIRQQKIQWKPFYIVLQEEISIDSFMIEYLCIYSYLVYIFCWNIC